MTMPMKISALSEESIVTLIDAFYLNVRKSPELKDIFERAIGTDKESWSVHLEKMYDFWSSLMLRSGKYNGNPMKVHQALPYFPPELFEVWLNLFTDTAQSLFNEEVSMRFIDKSKMIAQTLKSGIYCS